eukprot:29868-Eustigmatos_ZCMA.PRE.1
MDHLCKLDNGDGSKPSRRIARCHRTGWVSDVYDHRVSSPGPSPAACASSAVTGHGSRRTRIKRQHFPRSRQR